MEKKILLVEDDESLCRLLAKRIKKWGFEIIIAVDGKEALEKVKEEQPNLIILDLMLPKLPGEEVCRRIKSDMTIEKIPIIMLTAKTTDVDRIVGRVIGADYYLKKPFEVEELLAAINSCIGKSSAL